MTAILEATRAARSLLLLATVATTPACDSEPAAPCAEDLPDDWTCATPLALQVDATNCAGTTNVPAVLEILPDGMELTLVAAVVLFRDEQEVCAYQRADEPQVLLQPCEMRPDSVNKGECKYDFRVTLNSGLEGVASVEVFRRFDIPTGSEREPILKSLGEVAVP